MQFSALLDIAITLAATFVLTSLLCTTINELMVSLLKTRANTLHRTITALIDNEQTRQAFFESGLIRSLGIGSASGKSVGRPSYIDGRTFADALLASLPVGAPLPGVSGIRQSIASLPPTSKLRQALEAAISTAADDIGAARDEIARWFDGTMDRLTGYFTRYMKVLSLLVGLVVAAGLNIDAFDLAKASWQEDVRRAAVGIYEDYKGKKDVPCSGDEQLDCAIASLSGTVRELDSLPIGWGSLPPDNERTAQWYLVKLLGWIVTALAASVGAPFWFDVLQNVMSLRGAGTKRQDTQELPAAK